MSKRILDLNTISSASNDDYLVVDGNSGTRKITPENIVGNSTVAQSLLNQISDASDDIDEMQVTIGTLQSEIENIPVIDTTLTQSGEAADALEAGKVRDDVILDETTLLQASLSIAKFETYSYWTFGSRISPTTMSMTSSRPVWKA